MNYNQTVYQIYPLGFCGAPKDNDGITVHRILKVIDWIPHFKKLGITAVLFNPVLESDRHGYDTRDYAKIDCRLGTNEDFVKVCKALHKEDIKVILDGVFNHVGRGFIYFKDVQKKKQSSAYCNWFHINFDDQNNQDGFSYEGWEGHQELVRLNMDCADVRNYLLERTDQWIDEFGIDGLRLDVAYMVDRNFMHELCDHVRSSHPDFFFLGEMISGDYNEIMKDGLLDSVTNYECRKGLYSSMNSSNLFEIGYSLNRQFSNDQWSLYEGKHLLSFTDNHDVNRLASELSDPKDLPLTYALMYAMPGIPCIYYGSEWGTEGKRTDWSDDALRPCFDKPEWNSLCDYISSLDTLRKKYAVFTDGDYTQVYIQNQQLVFQRKDDHGLLTFAINIADEQVHCSFHTDIESGTDMLTKKKTDFSEGFDLPAKSAFFFYTKA
jgi:glycosidase